MYGRLLLAIPGLGLLCLGAFVGCDDLALPAPRSAAPVGEEPRAGDLFDPASAGGVGGRVTWSGKVPKVRPFRSLPSPLSGAGGAKQAWPNPHVPVIDPTTRGVANAVVFLRGVDPRRARAWDHPPVRVVQRGHRFHVLQGKFDGHIGLVRQGDAVEMVSEGKVFHALLGRGAAFFARTFPEPHQPCSVQLDHPGRVELSSGAGYYWMRAHLFVADHPYSTRTDRTGHFILSQVPPGTYEIVCWLPNWREQAHELDGDTGRVWRLTFRPPIQQVRRLHVPARQRVEVHFGLSADPPPR